MNSYCGCADAALLLQAASLPGLWHGMGFMACFEHCTSVSTLYDSGVIDCQRWHLHMLWLLQMSQDVTGLFAAQMWIIMLPDEQKAGKRSHIGELLRVQRIEVAFSTHRQCYLGIAISSSLYYPRLSPLAASHFDWDVCGVI
jgi:hypothetical protein